MFETVAPEKFAPRSRKVFYETLPISLALHAAVAASFLAANLWTISFPDQSPNQVLAFNIAELPPPPPPPPPPPKALAQPVAVKVAVVQPTEIVAPAIIPDEIPVVEATPMVAEVADAAPDGVEGGMPGGEVGGVFGGVSGGEKGGVIGGVMGGIVAEKNVVIIERDKPLPLYPMSQVYPNYPEEARLKGWEDSLVIRYVIATSGRIKEASILVPPARELFINPTLRAIRSWRFRPLVKDGQRQEVVHELTVFYKLTQS